MRRLIFKIMTLFLAWELAFTNSLLYAAIVPVENKRQWQAQMFIANQIKGIGLVDSYQEDNANTSYVYDNCMAAIACMLMGNFGLAEEILDTLTREVKNTPENVPFESYDYSDFQGNGRGLAYAGNSAWFLQTLNIYQKLKSDTKYYVTQKRLADFLLTLQDPVDGGLRGSLSVYWKSTEHNIIAYAALRNFGRLNYKFLYLSRAEKIKRFLRSPTIWDGMRFFRGANDPTEVTDVQALGVLLLGANYSSALTWAENKLKTTKPFNSDLVTGFDFNHDLDTVWLEGTLQMALAFYKINNSPGGNYYYREAAKTIQSDGSLLLATNRGTATEEWILESWRAIAPSAWLIFYYFRFNPLVIYFYVPPPPQPRPIREW